MARGSSPCGSSGRRDEWTEKTIYRIKWAVGLLWCFTVEFPLIENNQRKWIGKLLTNTWLRTPFFFLCVSFRFSLCCAGGICWYIPHEIWGWFVRAIEGWFLHHILIPSMDLSAAPLWSTQPYYILYGLGWLDFDARLVIRAKMTIV